ncbi:MAG TPA: FAD-dependent oxidoreductase [bacterium]|nr:FAD-dependent oxidoreductase [bacterium]HOL34953.1 FAD-dependent oxidoreductase [bacterium]HPP09104.1 FAD-dependent oxidoreductase [bacterium]HXK44378.1 FAD-dependent oxidoreductase [bacterium]
MKNGCIPEEADVVVIGAGIMGCSIAYYLSTESRKVVVFEKRNIASGASGRNGGQVIQLEGRDKNPETIKARLLVAKENNKILKNLEKELNVTLEYQKTGSLDIALNKEEWKDIKETVKIQQKAGDREIELLDKKETLKKCPLLTEKVYGARYRASDGTINPFFLTHGFAFNAMKKGARFFTNIGVKKIIKDNKKIKGIELENGVKVKCAAVINATNAWSTILCPEIDILPLRQVAVVTEQVAKLPVYPMEAFIEGDAIFTTTQTKSGNLLAGGFRTQARKRFFHYDETVSPVELSGSSAIFTRIFKGMEDISIIRCWSGTMAVTGDCLPCIGKYPETDNLYIAAGFSNGMAYGAIVGKLMSELLTRGKTSIPIDIYSPERFYKKGINWPELYNYTVLAEFFARV